MRVRSNGLSAGWIAGAVFAILTVLFLTIPTQGRQDTASPFERKNALIAMRDGVHLNTDVYAPRNPSGPLPLLLLRTPYGIDGDDAQFSSYLKELADEGYIFVFQDIRGRYKSEGQFVMSRAPRNKSDAKAIDESTDTYDTIEWLLKNVPNHNGRVGALGISYGGWLTVMAMLDPHPALKAVSPQASPADMFLGDDFHHNGAFRLSYGFEYVAMMETTKENSSFAFDRKDTYEWYLALGPLSNANARYFHGKLPTWNDFIAHPNYDAFWKKQAFAPYLTRVAVPTLNVAGWWDQEDFYGPIKIYELLEEHDERSMNHVVVGPWNHGGWAREDGTRLGNVSFDQNTSKYFREKIQAPFFAYYLKDKGKADFPEAVTFQTGSNAWKSYDSWPPRRQVTDRKLYFQANEKLSFDPPPAATSAVFDSYVSDPAHPVPYRPRPVPPTYPGPAWPTWLLEDQRFVHHRPDVLSWESDTLSQPVAISGDIVAHLFAATSGTDSDWIVKLIDVYPEDFPPDPKMGGYQLMIANDVFRGRFRKGFETPVAMAPNQPTEIVVDLHTNDHVFGKGHKIMVQVQSSWFPVIDRNPQTFVPNIFQAKSGDFRKATQRIYRSGRQASYVAVSVSADATSSPDH